MVHEVTVKVTAGVKDIRDGRKTVNMIYCLMENFPLGVHFLYQCTLQLAGLYFCVVKRIISEYVLNFRGTLSLSSLSARYDYTSETLHSIRS